MVPGKLFQALYFLSRVPKSDEISILVGHQKTQNTAMVSQVTTGHCDVTTSFGILLETS